MSCTVNRHFLQAGNKAVLYLALDISPPSVSEIPEAMKPLNVCLAIDRSGSMREEKKLEHAKLAASQLIQSLKPTDYVSIVTFADSVLVEVGAQPASDTYYFQQAIDSIKAKGLTDIYSALTASFDELIRVGRAFPEEPVSRIILLTDGQPTKGKEKVEEFVDLCTDLRRNDVSVTALGVGTDYNEQLLAAIGSHSGGAWYHVTDPRNLPAFFSEELVEMKTVVLLKPELRIQPMSGAELADIHKVRPMLDLIKDPVVTDGNYVVSMSDIVAGQPQNVVARFHLPPRPEGNYRIAHVELASRQTSLSEDVVVTYTNDSSLYEKETNPYPRVLLMTSEGTVLFRQGVSLGDETKISQAQTIVKGTLEDPNALTVLRTSDVVQDVVTRFRDASEKTAVKKGKLSEEDKKKIISETTVIKKRQ